MSNIGYSQQIFHKTWTGLEISNRSFVAANPLGGYYIGADYIATTTSVNEWFIISSYNECDSLKWSKTVQLQNAGLKIGHMITNKNGEVIIAGTYQGVNGDVFILKLTIEGQIGFFKRYEGNNTEYIYSMGEFENGGFFVYGITANAPRYRNYILKTDKNGEILWNKEYFTIPIWGRAIATKDGGVLANTGNVIFKVDDKGNLTWAKDFNDQIGYRQSFPIEVSDGYVYARCISSKFYDTTSYLFKIDFNGEVKWVGEYFKGASISRVIEVNDHFYTLSNYYFTGSTNSSMTITKLNLEGDLVKQIYKTNPSDKQTRSYDISSLSNGRLLISGIENDLLQQSNQLCYSVTDLSLDFGQCGEPITYGQKGHGVIIENVIDVTPVDLLFTELNLGPIVKNIILNEEVSCSKEIPLNLDIGDDIDACNDQIVSLESNLNFPIYRWSIGDTTKSIVVESSGEYILKVSDGCRSVSDTINVFFYPKIETIFTVSPLKVVPFEKVTFKGKNESSLKVLWTYDNLSTSVKTFTHKFDKNGIYPVVYQISDDYGCTYSDTIYVEVRLVSFFMPNSFSNNGDGLNDEFGPKGFGIEKFRLNIYNRWGDLIFDQENIYWDGSYNGKKSPIGQYVYQVELLDEFGESHALKGRFILLR